MDISLPLLPPRLPPPPPVAAALAAVGETEYQCEGRQASRLQLVGRREGGREGGRGLVCC